MKDLTRLFQSEIVPDSILVTYKEKCMYQETVSPYMETRKIHSDGTTGPAQPVSREFINSLVKLFSTEYGNIPFGIVPDNLLYIDTRKNRYVWYNPPMKRKMYFNDTIPLDDAEYNMPGFLYVVENGSLCVYSFKGKKPTLNSRISYAPAYNTTDGRVCLGSASGETHRPHHLTWNNLMNWWENKFWNSVNSHLGSNPTKGNLTILIKESRDMPFDITQLVQTGKRLGDFLK